MIHEAAQMLRAMFRIRLVRAIPLSVVVLVAACGSASPQPGAQSPAAQPGSCGGAGAGAVTAAASTYVMSLVVGPVEAMYSQADVSSQHPTTGEVMLRGEMDMQPGGGGGSAASMTGDMSGMNMSGSGAGGQLRHLEIHICTQSGTVIGDANPSIRLRDTTDGASVNVPVAVMQGVTSGSSDIHYGNNIRVTLGDTYYADVTLNGARATLRLPAS